MSKNRPHMMPRKYLDTADVIKKDLTRKKNLGMKLYTLQLVKLLFFLLVSVLYWYVLESSV